MPPLPPVERVSRVAVSGSLGGANWSNIFHFLWDTAPTDANMSELATEVGTLYDAQIMPNISSAVTRSSVIAVDLSAIPALPGGLATVTAGGSAGLPAGAQECILVKHTIARRYRGGHPRTYLPPGASGEKLDIDRWSGGAVTAFQAGFNAFISGVVAHAYTGTTLVAYVNVSYFSGHAVRVAPVVDVIVGSSVEAVSATQRRRVGR